MLKSTAAFRYNSLCFWEGWNYLISLSLSLFFGFFFFFVSMLPPLSCHPQSGFEKERKESKRLILTGLPQRRMARRRGLEGPAGQPHARRPWAARSFRSGGSHLGLELGLAGPHAGCQPLAARPGPSQRPCFGRWICSLLVSCCLLTSFRGKPGCPESLLRPPQTDPPPSAFLYVFFLLSSPSLSHTLVSISAAAWTPDFRSVNKLATFPAVQNVRIRSAFPPPPSPARLGGVAGAHDEWVARESGINH